MAFGFGRKPKADVEAGNATRHRATTTTAPRKGFFSVDADDLHSAAQEFLGTALFIMLGLGGIQAASTQWGAEGSATSNGASGSLSASPPPSVERLVFFLYVSLSLGFSLLVSAWMFFRVTGGLFNPNVSLALCIVGVISPIRLFLYTIAQFSGAIAGAALVRGLTPGPTPPLVLNTTLAPGLSHAQGVFIEMFITAALILSILMLGAEKHIATPFAPVGVGVMIFVTHLFAASYTGASMNTARSFAAAAITGFPHTTHWVYWVGPYLGSLLAVVLYSILKHFRYWRLNPHADSAEPEKSPEDPIERIRKITSTSGGNGP